MTNVAAISSGELLSLFAGVLVELRRRGLVRTANTPVADLGERLFCEAMGWEREHHQDKNFNASTADGARVQIKSRRLTRTQVSARSATINDKDGFDLVAIAMFGADFEIDRAVIVPREAALRHLKWSKRQKGWYISFTRRFWTEPDLIDVTDSLDKQNRGLLSRTS